MPRLRQEYFCVLDSTLLIHTPVQQPSQIYCHNIPICTSIHGTLIILVYYIFLQSKTIILFLMQQLILKLKMFFLPIKNDMSDYDILCNYSLALLCYEIANRKIRPWADSGGPQDLQK